MQRTDIMLLMYYLFYDKNKDKETYHLRVTLGAAVNIFYLLISCNRDIAGLNLCSTLYKTQKCTTTSGLFIHGLPSWSNNVCLCSFWEFAIEWACECLQCGRKHWENEWLLIHQLLVARHKICHCMMEVHNKVSGQPRGGENGMGERKKEK